MIRLLSGTIVHAYVVHACVRVAVHVVCNDFPNHDRSAGRLQSKPISQTVT